MINTYILSDNEKNKMYSLSSTLFSTEYLNNIFFIKYIITYESSLFFFGYTFKYCNQIASKN